MYYSPDYFTADEFVPPHVFDERGEKAFELIDVRLLITYDMLRKKYGPCIINNYTWGGNREWSGLRTPDSPYYRQYSQHTYGRAGDSYFANVTPKQIRDDILNYPDHPAFRYITAIEDKVSWLHVDVRNVERVFLFNP